MTHLITLLASLFAALGAYKTKINQLTANLAAANTASAQKDGTIASLQARVAQDGQSSVQQAQALSLATAKNTALQSEIDDLHSQTAAAAQTQALSLATAKNTALQSEIDDLHSQADTAAASVQAQIDQITADTTGNGPDAPDPVPVVPGPVSDGVFSGSSPVADPNSNPATAPLSPPSSPTSNSDSATSAAVSSPSADAPQTPLGSSVSDSAPAATAAPSAPPAPATVPDSLPTPPPPAAPEIPASAQ